LFDWYLAKNGYSLQVMGEPADPAHPDNLLDPVAGDFDTHGRFDSRAANTSLQLWATEHRRTLLTIGLTVAALIATMLIRPRPLARQIK
jgi:hypothetical protein